MSIDWDGMLAPTVSPIELIIRGSIMYLAIFAAMRILRRESGQLSTADLILVVLVADAAQNGLAADYHSITEGMILVGTIFAWNYGLDWLGYHFEWAHRILTPAPLLLVRDGRIMRSNLRLEMLTVDDLRNLLREHGVEDLAQIRRSYLEPDGRLSVIKHRASSR